MRCSCHTAGASVLRTLTTDMYGHDLPRESLNVNANGPLICDQSVAARQKLHPRDTCSPRLAWREKESERCISIWQVPVEME